MRMEQIRPDERYSFTDQWQKNIDTNTPANENTSELPKTSTMAVQELSDEQIDEIISKLNKAADIFELNVQYKIKLHEETNTQIVQIVRNDQVLTEMPPERLLDALAKIEENLLGMIVDQRV